MHDWIEEEAEADEEEGGDEGRNGRMQTRDQWSGAWATDKTVEGGGPGRIL